MEQEDMRQNATEFGADPALAVPAKPVSRLDASRCDQRERFTPGPWAVVHKGGEVGVMNDPDCGVWVATTGLAGHDEPEANARMIAALSNLIKDLESSDKIADCLERVADDHSGCLTEEDAFVVECAIAALRKARGGA